MFLSLSSSSSSFVSSSSFMFLGATFVAKVFFVDADKSELSTSNVISPLARPSLENSFAKASLLYTVFQDVSFLLPFFLKKDQ